MSQDQGRWPQATIPLPMLYPQDMEAMVEAAWQFADELTGELSSYFAPGVKVVPATAIELRPADKPVCWMTLGKLARGPVLLETDSLASFLIIEGMLGGRLRAVTSMARGFTSIELELLRQFAEVAGQAFTQARWRRLGIFSPGPAAGEKPPEALSGTRLGFLMKAGNVKAAFGLFVPLLQDGGLMEQAQPSSEGTRAELKVLVEAGELTSAEIGALSPGALLVTENKVDPEVILKLEGLASFKGKLRSHRGHKVVIITEKLGHNPQPDIPPPEAPDNSAGI